MMLTTADSRLRLSLVVSVLAFACTDGSADEGTNDTTGTGETTGDGDGDSGDGDGDSGDGDGDSGDGDGDGDPDHNPLWIPDTIEGTTFDLTLSPSTKQFLDGSVTNTYAFNGNEFWGPTLIMQQGDVVQMNVTNDLDDMTTTHWHGFHIPAITDGGPHQMIDPGTTWTPSFEVMNNAATYWYHPHLHEATQEQLTYGAGGLIIVRDAEEAALALPRTYGVDDIPLVLTSRRFDDDNQFNLVTAYGDYMLTNGTMNAAVTLPAQLVRMRILNAEIERSYNLGFSDDRTFYVIGTDGGLLDAPVPVTRAKLYVGERMEILVDLSTDAVGSSFEMQAFNGGQPMGFPGGEPDTTGMFGSLLNNTTFDILHIEVGDATPDAITDIPATLASNALWTAADATNTRELMITDMGPMTPFTFDGIPFDIDVINQNIVLDTVEMWTISNGPTFDHSFHIHDVQFSIVERSDGPIADYEKGWKDTLRVPRNGSVSFVAKFEDFTSDTDPYMYHCHMVDHEDDGLMGQFLVQ